MTIEDFDEIFQSKSFAIPFRKGIIMEFGSLHGFHTAISKYGTFESHRRAVELGYDVEFTLDRP